MRAGYNVILIYNHTITLLDTRNIYAIIKYIAFEMVFEVEIPIGLFFFLLVHCNNPFSPFISTVFVGEDMMQLIVEMHFRSEEKFLQMFFMILQCFLIVLCDLEHILNPLLLLVHCEFFNLTKTYCLALHQSQNSFIVLIAIIMRLLGQLESL